ncbi:MAG: hypothetical protein ACKOGH_06980 [Alphaproteobacteria bacterium]
MGDDGRAKGGGSRSTKARKARGEAQDIPPLLLQEREHDARAKRRDDGTRLTIEHLDAVATVLRRLPEVRTTTGLALLIEARLAHARGRRPVTWGEGHGFVVRERRMSAAGTKKTIRRLIGQKMLVTVPSPCIDKALDLQAGPRLLEAIPVVGKPYTIYRVGSDGDLVRRRFDTDWLEGPHVAEANRPLAGWMALWRDACPAPGLLPRSLRPFFASPLSRLASPAITAIVDVSAAQWQDYAFMVSDGPAAEDPPFRKSMMALRLGNCRIGALSRVLRADFTEAKTTGRPMFHRLLGTLRGSEHDYHRLMLPLALAGDAVDCLLIVSELSRFRPDAGND